jgi:hypothetical protein
MKCGGYVTDKLSYNQPRDFRQCISDEKTKKRWIEQMKEEPPKDPDIVAEQINTLFSHYTLEKETEAALAITDMYSAHPELYGWLGGSDIDVWESCETEPSWAYVFLRDELLPFFFKYLRENVVGVEIGTVMDLIAEAVGDASSPCKKEPAGVK